MSSCGSGIRIIGPWSVFWGSMWFGDNVSVGMIMGMAVMMMMVVVVMMVCI